MTMSKELKKFEDVDVQNVDSILEAFASVDDNVLLGMTAEYLKFTPNTKYDLVFTGMTKFKGEKGEEIPAAQLSGKGGLKYINGSAVLVSALKKVTTMPCLVRIVTKELVKGDNGKYMAMEVFVIPSAAKQEIA